MPEAKNDEGIEKLIQELLSTGRVDGAINQRIQEIMKDPARRDLLFEELRRLGVEDVGSSPLGPIDSYYREGAQNYSLRWPLNPALQLSELFPELDRKSQFFILFGEWSRREMEGNAAINSGQIDSAEEIFRECLERSEQIDVAELKARSCEGMMRAGGRRGDRKAQLEWSKRAMEFRGDMVGSTKVQHDRLEAMLASEEGRLPEAESKLGELIKSLDPPIPGRMAYELSQCLMDRATVRRYMNKWEEALADLGRVDDLLPALPAVARAGVLQNQHFLRARIHLTPYASAFDLAKAANSVAALRELVPDDWIVTFLEGDLAFRSGEWAKAADCALRTARDLKAEGWDGGAATSILRAGEALTELRQLDLAEAHLMDALQFFEQKGPPDQLAATRLALARLRMLQGDHEQAWILANKAIDGAETSIRRFKVQAEQQRFLTDKLKYYDVAFEAGLAKTGSEGILRAWTIVERAKGFYLCQIVANADVPVFEEVEPSEVSTLSQLEEELDAAERTRGLLDPREAAGQAGRLADERIQSISARRIEVLNSMMRKNPRWATLRAPPHFDMADIIERLSASWVPISFYWRKEPEAGLVRLHIFYVDAGGSPQCDAVPWTGAEYEQLEASRMRLRDPLIDKLLNPNFPLPEDLASKILPRRVRVGIKKGKPLLFSPHGRLHGLPLHTILIGPDTMPIDDWPIQYIPTFGLIPLRRERVTPEKVLLLGSVLNGFGDPQLDNVDDELEQLNVVWRTKRPHGVEKCSIGPNASPAEAGCPLGRWGEFGILHFACHGVFREEQPFDSALRLGSAAIHGTELFGVRLNAAVVSLSACSLGRQAAAASKDIGLGDEWVGLYLPLLYAGAEHVVVSLWDAHSETAQRFMVPLHRALSDRMAPVEAFKRACKAVRAAALPLWANWVLVGFPAVAP